MDDKKTDDLLDSLKKADTLQSFLDTNDEHMIKEPLHIYLTKLLEQKNLKKPEVSQKADLSDIYVYQLFSGFRFPSRDKLLCLCFGMECTLEETNLLLKVGGFSTLYVKQKRDSIITWALENRLSITETETLLFEQGLMTLHGKM